MGAPWVPTAGAEGERERDRAEEERRQGRPTMTNQTSIISLSYTFFKGTADNGRYRDAR